VQRVALTALGYSAMQRMLAVPSRDRLAVDNHLAGVGALHAALHAASCSGADSLFLRSSTTASSRS